MAIHSSHQAASGTDSGTPLPSSSQPPSSRIAERHAEQQDAESESEPESEPEHVVRISRIAGRYLVFDVDDLMRLRRRRDLGPVLAGTIPQNPQQNGFMGLPAELMDEEAAALVARGLARVVDDAEYHTTLLGALSSGGKGQASGADVAAARREYLAALRGEGRRARDEAAELARLNKIRSLEQAANKKRKGGAKSNKAKPAAAPQEDQEDSLFDGFSSDPSGASASAEGAAAAATSSAPASAPPAPSPWAVTPTTSGALLGLDGRNHAASAAAPRPSPLHAHLHGRGYFMMPGLRFGCDYNVYPGDPLRFHSHFQATAYGWDEPIAMLDLVGGGRLGTGVKKGFLVGGAVDDVDFDFDRDGAAEAGQQQVRTFCIEWAGM